MEAELIETITIESATKERDRQDRLQWAIRYNAPSISRYPMPAWLPVGNTEIVKGDTHRAKLRRGKLKQDKDGNYKSDYYWEIEQLDTQEPAPQPPEKPAQGASGPSSLDLRIAWNSSINNAVNLYGALSEAGPGFEPDWELIHHYAAELYRIIVAGPPQGPLETWKPSGEPPQEATERPQAAPGSKGGKPWCTLHNKGLGEINQDGQKTYAHPHPDGGWCYGVTEEADA